MLQDYINTNKNLHLFKGSVVIQTVLIQSDEMNQFFLFLKENHFWFTKKDSDSSLLSNVFQNDNITERFR